MTGACYSCGQPGGRPFPDGRYCLACRPAQPAPGRYCAPGRCYCGQCPQPVAWDAAKHLGHLPGRCDRCGAHDVQGHRRDCEQGEGE